MQFGFREKIRVWIKIIYVHLWLHVGHKHNHEKQKKIIFVGLKLEVTRHQVQADKVVNQE